MAERRPPRQLILIKHAQPQVVQGTPADQWRLSDLGRAACAPLAARVAPYEPRVIVSSLEPKAHDTADLVGQRLGVPVTTAADLHEHDRRNVPMLASREFISLVELFFRRPGELVLGAETAHAASARFRSAVDEVLIEHAEGNVAVVAHGTVIALLVAHHNPSLKGFDLWRRLGLPSLVVLSVPEMQVVEMVERVGA
jgi:broad specificity phosphatase PhoE